MLSGEDEGQSIQTIPMKTLNVMWSGQSSCLTDVTDVLIHNSYQLRTVAVESGNLKVYDLLPITCHP